MSSLELSVSAVAQHKAWLVAQSATSQRLVVSNKQYEGTDYQTWELNGVRIEDCQFRKSDFRYAMLQEAEIVRSQFHNTLFLGSRMQRSSWVDLYVEDCNFNLARLNSVTAQGCKFADTQFFRAQWLDAKVSKMDFIRCSLHDSTWNNAIVANSDFRGTHLGATKGFSELATTAGATFVDCDLRNTTWRGRDLAGATFIRCKFMKSDDEIYSAVGAPRDTNGLTIKDCDVSKEQLLSELLREDHVAWPD